MHLIFTESEEFGIHRGLDLVPGRVRRLPDHVIVPHMGWNELRQQKQNALLKGLESGSFVYFVHSYYADPNSHEVTLATTDHGLEFAAIVHKDNIWATQFHPEKSQKVGERLLDNFARI
jgi:glutamine amidotransferase